MGRPDRNESPFPTCCCESEMCDKIRYSSQGNFCLASTKNEFIKGARLLGIRSKNKQYALWRKRNHLYVACWHFHQNHRSSDNNGDHGGKWSLNDNKPGQKYYDKEGVGYDFPPPNNSVLRYIT